MSTKIHPLTTIYGMFGRVKFGLPHTWIEFFNAVIKEHLLNERKKFKVSFGHSFPPPQSMALFMMPIDLGKPIDSIQAGVSFLLALLMYKALSKTNRMLTMKRAILTTGVAWAALVGVYWVQANPFLGETGLLNPFNIATLVFGALALDYDSTPKNSSPIPVVSQKRKKRKV